MSFVKTVLKVTALFLIVCAVSGLIGLVYHFMSSAPIAYCEYMTFMIVSMIMMLFGVFAMLRGYHPGKNAIDTDTDFDPRWGVRNPIRMIFVGVVFIAIGLGMFFAALYIESLLH